MPLAAYSLVESAPYMPPYHRVVPVIRVKADAEVHPTGDAYGPFEGRALPRLRTKPTSDTPTRTESETT